MPAKMNINLSGDIFTDELHTDVGAAVFRINHDWFIDLVINTATGGGGTALELGIDYVLSTEDTKLSERVTDELGVSKNVWGEIQIINAVYQAGDLYFSGKYIADSIEAKDANPPNVLIITGDDYPMQDNDDYDEYWFDPDGANRTFIFADPAINIYRKVKLRNIGDGTHKITLLPFDTEHLLVYSGNEKWELASFELLQQDDWAEFQADGTNWPKCNAPYWHKISDPTTGWKATKTTGWTADQFTPGGLEVTFSTLPIGSLAADIMMDFLDTIQYGIAAWRKSGDANISNTPVASTESSHQVLYIEAANGHLRDQIIVWLSSGLKTEFATRFNTGDLNVSYPISYLQ